MLQLVGRKGSQPCMNGMSILNDRVRKNVLIFSLMVVKPPHEIASAALQQKPQQKEEQKEATADATADDAQAPQPTPNPKQELAPTAV